MELAVVRMKASPRRRGVEWVQDRAAHSKGARQWGQHVARHIQGTQRRQLPGADKARKLVRGTAGRVGGGRARKAPCLLKVHIPGLGLARLLRDGSKEEGWEAEYSK